MLNLISNAVKFTGREGKILVEVTQLNGQLKLSVLDNGLGIKKKHHKCLFKMFGSIKNEKKKVNTNGIGLGLVISKLLVNKFKGEIDFRSKWKRGSTFFFTFETKEYELSEYSNQQKEDQTTQVRLTSSKNTRIY